MDILIAILGGSAGAALIAGAFTLVQWLLNRKAQKEDRAEDKRFADCTARGQEIQALLAGTKYLMYDRIRHLCETYIARGEITVTELKVLTDMHACYHDDLNGNGFLDELMEAVHDSAKVIPDRRQT